MQSHKTYSFTENEVFESRVIQPSENKMRLDKWLVTHYPSFSRIEWQKRIEQKKVLLNGKFVRKSKMLSRGDIVTIVFPKKKEPAVNENYFTLWENDFIILFDKPPDLPVHPSGAYYQNTLQTLYEKKTNQKIFFAHRIDRETSGLVLAAKNARTANTLSKFWSEFQKEYLVLVEGNFPRYYRAKGFIGLDTQSPVRKKRKFSLHPFPNAKTAITDFYCIKRQNNLSLLKAKLFTGRTHQIRATLCSLGFPVVGDKIYGVDETCYLRFLTDSLTKEDKQKLKLNHTALCHVRLTFPPNLVAYWDLPWKAIKSNWGLDF